jgi:hypothetical protein
MKRTLLSFFTLLLLASFSYAQNFEDDFESYNEGDYIGLSNSTWTTWSGNVGTTEDAQVTKEQAFSGTKSIKFTSTATNGGPQDVILPFGAAYTSGFAHLSMNFYIENAHNGYFNLQGNVVVGDLWSINVFFDEDGTIRVTDSANNLLMSGSFNHNEWFNFALDLNLTTNSWKVTSGGDCLGSFANPNNRIASMDLFPLNNSSFFVDDVVFNYDVNAPTPTLDVGISAFNFASISLTGDEVPMNGTVRNFGATTVTSFDVTYTYDGNNQSEAFNGLNIGSGSEYNFLLPFSHTVTEGNQEVSIALSNINGSGADEEMCNDNLSSTIRGVTPAANKKVVVEEATGTWCQWCPRGDVFMQYMSDKYPEHFIGIAVHASNGGAIDPMDYGTHSDGIRATPGFMGFPSVIVMRNGIEDPSTMELPSIDLLTIPPVAVLTNGATYDQGSRLLKVSVDADFQTTVGGAYKIAVFITEDGVTGTSSLFNQANQYSGGGFGQMGGYENLPDPVPAAQMVYNHVSRATLDSYGGTTLPSTDNIINAGETKTLNFSYTIPQNYNTDNMHIISVLVEPSGRVNNGNSVTIEEAVANGFTSGIEDLKIANNAEVYPNPFSNITNIDLDLSEAAEVKINVVSSMGALVASRNYGKQSGHQIFQFDGSSIPDGVYFMQVIVNGELSTRKITIAH